MSEDPRWSGGGELNQTANRHTTCQPLRKQQRQPGADSGQAIALARTLGRQLLRDGRAPLSMVGCDDVNRAISHALPHRFALDRIAKRRADEEPLCVHSVVAPPIEQQMVKTDFREHGRSALAPSKTYLAERARTRQMHEVGWSACERPYGERSSDGFLLHLDGTGLYKSFRAAPARSDRLIDEGLDQRSVFAVN